MKKILYMFFPTAIIAVIVFNLKIGNTFPAWNLLSFNLYAMSSESSPGESGAKNPKCQQKYNSNNEAHESCPVGSYYSNYYLTTHTYECVKGANTSNGCRTGVIKIGHDCNNTYNEPWEFSDKVLSLPYASGCPKK